MLFVELNRLRSIKSFAIRKLTCIDVSDFQKNSNNQFSSKKSCVVVLGWAAKNEGKSHSIFIWLMDYPY